MHSIAQHMLFAPIAQSHVVVQLLHNVMFLCSTCFYADCTRPCWFANDSFHIILISNYAQLQNARSGYCIQWPLDHFYLYNLFTMRRQVGFPWLTFHMILPGYAACAQLQNARSCYLPISHWIISIYSLFPIRISLWLISSLYVVRM